MCTFVIQFKSNLIMQKKHTLGGHIVLTHAIAVSSKTHNHNLINSKQNEERYF